MENKIISLMLSLEDPQRLGTPLTKVWLNRCFCFGKLLKCLSEKLTSCCGCAHLQMLAIATLYTGQSAATAPHPRILPQLLICCNPGVTLLHMHLGKTKT